MAQQMKLPNRSCFTPQLYSTLRCMMRVLIVSWFMLQCLVLPIGAQILPATTYDFTATDAAEQEEHSSYDEGLAWLVPIRNDTLARKTVPLVTTCAPKFCSRVSLTPQLIGPTVTASPCSHALPVQQLISAYRI